MTSLPLPMPLGTARYVELSRMRVESTQLAATIDDLAEHLSLAPGLPIEVLDALREALVVDEHARDDGVRPDLELLRSSGRTAAGGRPSRRTTPCRSPPRSCRSSDTAGSRDRPGQIGAASRHERHADRRLAGLHHQPLGASQLRRRQEVLAARQRVGVVVAATDADQLIDLVVVRRDVAVADGPRDLPAVALAGPWKSSSL